MYFQIIRDTKLIGCILILTLKIKQKCEIYVHICFLTIIKEHLKAWKLGFFLKFLRHVPWDISLIKFTQLIFTLVQEMSTIKSYIFIFILLFNDIKNI